MGRGPHKCNCRHTESIGRSQPLGLDELMIVNPGPPGLGRLFISGDGTLYRVGAFNEPPEIGRYFLGADGTLYEVVPR